MNKKQDIIQIAKRENNKKRTYLVVNRFQGKHVPVSPLKAFEMFDALAQLLLDTYSNERLLLIGFAETATAIGAEVAIKLDSYYIHTTREPIENVEYLFFSEDHSHATLQKLVKNDLDRVMDSIDRIIFIEDEVTTGNTIQNIISILKKEYKNPPSFSIASLLNGMQETDLERFKTQNIPLHYLIKTDHTPYPEIAEKYAGNGIYHACQKEDKNIPFSTQEYKGYLDARRLINGRDYQRACERLWLSIREHITLSYGASILVLGTEEFMFPALYVASKIEDMGYFVRFHATTRSPILVDEAPNYPLHQRYELKSLYDPERTTFLYDLKQYDCCYVITDAIKCNPFGKNSLIHALKDSGNSNLNWIQWHGSRDQNGE